MCNMGDRLKMLEMRYKQINEQMEKQKKKVPVCETCGQPTNKRNIAWEVFHDD